MKKTLPRTVDDFMAYACAMEAEASERYAELADLMAAHHNHDVADLFARLSLIEGKHRDQILEQMNWTTAPAAYDLNWETPEAPETTGYGDLHYLMVPFHALTLAAHNERRAVEFFERFAQAQVPAVVRAAAAGMAEDEREHVRWIESWLAKVEPPPPDWDDDFDPPNAVD